MGSFGFRRLQLVAAAAAVGLIGCSPLVGPNYKGVPLATYSGEVHANGNASVGPTDAAIVWFQDSGRDGHARPIIAERIAVEATFPARFTLQIFEPPPPNSFLLGAAPGARVAGGYIIAIDANAPDVIRRQDIKGMTFTHMVLYVADVASLSLIRLRLPDPNGRLKVGYNLIAYVDTPEEAALISTCRSRVVEDWDEEDCADACDDSESCLAVCDAGPQASNAYDACRDYRDPIGGPRDQLQLNINPDDAQANDFWDSFY